MPKFLKKCTCAISIFTAAIMAAVGFYSKTLPDSFVTSKGERLMIDSHSTLFSVSAQPLYSSCTDCRTNAGTGKSTLMLFGKIPIKDVSSESVERPMLVPCGQTFGIKLISDGVMVIDTAGIEGKNPALESGIKKGDIIVSINGEKIGSNDDISRIISDSDGNCCHIVYKRKGSSRQADLTPVLSCGVYKAGLWVRDSSAGIGTLTFYDAQTKAFAGLGHPICDSDTGEILPLSKGIAGEVKITGCTKSCKGSPGQLLGEFTSSGTIGQITSNCSAGVYGSLNENPSDNEAVPMGFRQEIKKGKAKIISTTEEGSTEEYSISIEKINLEKNAEHDLIIKVTDKRLIEKTGGIVQGMSGSPIIQDGRIVGAVTHVFIDDPAMGYGIFADRMYSESEKAAENAD